MSRRRVSFKGDGTVVQWTKSFEREISTPGYHSKVEFAIKYSPFATQMEGSGWNPGKIGLLSLTVFSPLLAILSFSFVFIHIQDKPPR
jgi:hypothetical protein